MGRHVARKRFGQNFLIDSGVIGEIIAAIAPQRDDRLVEIGPGLGALTEPLLERLDTLHVVEIDRDIVARLRERQAPDRLTIHEGDALTFDFGALARRVGGKLRVVGNLPYNISTPLLFHLAKFVDETRDMHFMLQKEVVDRMAAVPGTADYGRLSVMLQYRFVIDRLFDVPPESFDPAPKVDSAFVRLIPRGRDALTVRDEASFEKIVAAAFGQRRKMLRNNLKDLVERGVFDRVGIAPTVRAEELTVADYIRLANALVETGESP